MSVSPRILITRLSHIGDCLLTMPLLTELRRHFPTAHIAWAVEPSSATLLEGHPDLNQLIRVPKNWIYSWRAIGELRRVFRETRFDIAIDPQSLTKSAAIAWLSGAKIRIGMGGIHAREFSRWLNNHCVVTTQDHLVDRTLELLRALNIQPGPARLRLLHHHPSLMRIRGWVDQQNLGDRFVVINPGATWPSKLWELDRFSRVAQHCHKTHRLKSIVTWAGSQERYMAETIVRGAPDSAVLAPKTDLRELAALLSYSRLYIGCDTGPMHIATAVGTSCVALFGPTRPQDSGPYGTGHIALQAWHQRGGNRQRRTALNLAMRDISVENVCRGIDQALSAWQNSARPNAA